MIDIIRKEDCVGCNACVQRCPRRCISMKEDSQGFLYPKVDVDSCIECGLCEKVCPVINKSEPKTPLSVYAAKNKDKNIRANSSSGGIFAVLAESVLKEGGVVFGAKFNDRWEVVHGFAETVEEAVAFRVSKYVQSRIGDTYQQAEQFLRSGRKVLFTGTPCQIRGLKLFLRKDYENLIAVEVICHGVPSPLIWREYLKHIIARPTGAHAGKNTDFISLNGIPAIAGISFRDKRIGWEKYGFSVRLAATNGSGKNSDSQSVNIGGNIYSYHQDDPYFWNFNNDNTLRPCCFACPSKAGKSNSDISLGDFWHIESYIPTFYDNNGVSLVLAYSSKGKEMLEILNLSLRISDYDTALNCVPSIKKIELKPKNYDKFWQEFYKNGISVLKRYHKKYRFTKVQKYLKNPLKKLVGDNFIKHLKKYFR